MNIGLGIGIGFAASPPAAPSLSESLLALSPACLLIVSDAGHAASWTDLSGRDNRAVQSTEGLRPTYTADGGLGGKPGLIFDGTEYFDFVTDINSNDLIAIAALSYDNVAGDQCLITTQSSSRAFLLNRSGQVAIYDSAFKSFGATTSGAQRLAWRLDTADSGTSQMFRNGASLGTDTYDGTFWPISTGARLGALAGGTPAWLAQMTLSAVAIFESASLETLAAADAALAAEYF